MFPFLKKSLGNQIICVLTAIVVVVMTAIILLTNAFQTKRLLSEMSRTSEGLILAITAGMKYPMSQGHNDVIHRQMNDIKQNVPSLELYICNPEGRIVFSTERMSVGGRLDDVLTSREVLSAVRSSLAEAKDSPGEYEEERGGSRYLSHVHVIRNGPECVRCHPGSKTVIGAAVMRMSTDEHYAEITGFRNAGAVISVLGVVLIIGLVGFLLNGLVTRPIKVLAGDLHELPEKIQQGLPITSIDIPRDDEIGVLQRSFHEMAWELDKITNAMEKANLELEHANSELESFAYSVSHDLRAPLRNIDGFSKILLDEYQATLDDRAKHYLSRVRNGTAKMSMLIDDILMFSRIGRAEMQFRIVPADAIVRSVLEYYAADIEKRGVQVEIADLPAINCDQTLAQSLFSNLISNALKYTRQVDAPRITVGFDEQLRAIFVRDNGIGFEMKYHDKIFQVFQRLHLPEEYEGTGIGLAIVKRIAERHHWRVSAESEPGKGATFLIELP